MHSLKTLSQAVKKQPVLVSGCILGRFCSYNGSSAKQQLTTKIIDKLQIKPVPSCPEVEGGLSTPRARAEITNGDGYDVISGNAQVITETGDDVTQNYLKGAEKALEHCEQTGAKLMITQRRSPSCSASSISDGTFTKTRIKGVGVTIAYLQENGIATIELENVVQLIVENLLLDLARDLHEETSWTKALVNGQNQLQQWFSCDDISSWEKDFLKLIEFLVPEILSQADDLEENNSDTYRYFKELFHKTYNITLNLGQQKCKICTYPQGFLDSYIDSSGICSACREYASNRQTLQNTSDLKEILKKKIQEVKGYFDYDAIIAYSGGKDSVYMMSRLKEHYQIKALCVMDMLNQQSDLALINGKTCAENAGFDLLLLDNIPCASNVRKNFIQAGCHFCRLCLRAHFVRIYKVACAKKVPLIFFGLSPYQCLDCVDAIRWTMQSINDVKTPLKQLDGEKVRKRYIHRTFQGGFDVGFKSHEERELLEKWEKVFAPDPENFTPLIIPFFIYDGYPDEESLIQHIMTTLGWKEPQQDEMLYSHTNCRLLPWVGTFYHIVNGFHPNYKESATKLRLRGAELDKQSINSMYNKISTLNQNELKSAKKLLAFLSDEYKVNETDIPQDILKKIYTLLPKE